MNYMRLLKLLYIADRESLEEAGCSITGSRAVAMERGPVLEDVYNLIRGTQLHADRWAEHFHSENYHLVMHDDPGMTCLTKFIANKLTQISDRYKGNDEWEMVDITHQFPEWINNNPGNSSKHIPIQDILKAVGRLEEMPDILGNAYKSASSGTN